MPILEMLCLANSKKLSGRCVAGLRLDNHNWIRPVSPHVGGAIASADCRFATGEQVALLQVVRIDFRGSAMTNYHPEDYHYNRLALWQYVFVDSVIINKLINDKTNTQADLIFGYGDRISMSRVDAQNPLKTSLQLIIPDDPRLCVTTNMSGSKQYRLIFDYEKHQYSLVITDLVFIEKFKVFTQGIHYFSELGFTNLDRIRLTISLGEPFNGAYFKLVAAIIEI